MCVCVERERERERERIIGRRIHESSCESAHANVAAMYSTFSVL